MQPYYYCSKCRERVMHIVEVYREVKEDREWDGECYELVDSSLTMDTPISILCGRCQTALIEKMEGEN
jgi:hypothetical protein